jgi:hypothetical protein
VRLRLPAAPWKPWRAAAGFAGLLLLAGCAHEGPLVFKEDRYPALGLEAQAASVEIRDRREGRDSLRFPPDKGRRTLAKHLSSRDTSVIRSQVGRNLLGQGLALHLQVEVEQADLTFEYGLLRGMEAGRTKVRIRFQHGNARLAECTGTATLEKRSPRGRSRPLEDLFAEGLAMAVYGCLESTKEELKKSVRGAPGRSRI